MKHCALCGWSGDDSYTRCPNAATHQTRSVATAVAEHEETRFNAVAGGKRIDGLRGPVRHWLSHKMDVYQNDLGQYVTADGKPVRGQRKGLR